MTNVCPIWGTPAVFEFPGGDHVVVQSQRAGGGYRLAGSANLQDLLPRDKAKLTSWLAEQRRLGENAPLITNDTLDTVRSLPDPTVLERRDRALECLAQKSPTLGSWIKTHGVVDGEMKTVYNDLVVATGSQTKQEAEALLKFLSHAGFTTESALGVSITFEGWSHLENQRADQLATVQAFVAMWFDPALMEAYRDGIAPAVTECGYRPIRIDEKQHINKIDDEIISEIRRSRFLIADFTSERDRPRGGVYFEAGLAIGLNKPVIWTCRQDMIDQVHFDTRQFNHITWVSPSDLRQKLRARIGAVLGDGPLLKTIGGSPSPPSRA